MTITGVHGLIYTTEPEALRAVFRDVFGWEHVDAGEGWLIFALPPTELGVHPAEQSVDRDLLLMCDDLQATMAELQAKGIRFAGEQRDEPFGLTVTMVLPGATEMLLYQPRHLTAI